MKRVVIVTVILIFLFQMTGCSSAIQKAEKLHDNGEYLEAIALLEQEESEEAKALSAEYAIEYAQKIAAEDGSKAAIDYLEGKDLAEAGELIQTYKRDYVDQLMSDGDYQTAKSILQELESESYDIKLLRQCNIGILYQAIEEFGTKGSNGKRLYVNTNGAEVFLENVDETTLIMGYDFSNTVGGNHFELYIDGSDSPYFEAVQEISFSLFGQEIATSSTGYGSVDLSKASGRYQITVDSFQNSGAVNTSGNTVSDVLDQSSFNSIFNDALNVIVSNMPRILEKSETGITMEEIGFQ